MHKAFLCFLGIVGFINIAPLLGIVSAEKLNQAYGLVLEDSNLVILMRHRALLFGILGGFILYSIFSPQYQSAAMIMAAISMVGYLVLMISTGNYNTEIWKVAIVDLVGLVSLASAAALKYWVIPN